MKDKLEVCQTCQWNPIMWRFEPDPCPDCYGAVAALVGFHPQPTKGDER